MIFGIQHRTETQSTRDKIRLNALCEAANTPNTPTTASDRGPHPEPRPKDFREAGRQTWQRNTPAPVMKQSRRAQPIFHLQQESNSHVAIARRTIARLKEYDKTMKPGIDFVSHASEGKAPKSSVTMQAGGLSAAVEQTTVDASRDPRLARSRP